MIAVVRDRDKVALPVALQNGAENEDSAGVEYMVVRTAGPCSRHDASAARAWKVPGKTVQELGKA